MDDTERIRQLMMASVDGELDENERGELDRGLAEHPGLRIELRRMEELSRRLAGFKLVDPADAVLAELDRTLVKRAGLPFGWLLVMAGVLLVFGWLAWDWFFDPELSAVMRWGGIAFYAGLIVLLIVKIRERWIEWRSDPYRDVIR